MAIAVMLNNFMHDFCAAGWIFGAVVLWMSARKISAANNNIEPQVREIIKLVLLLMRLSALGLIVFGIVRAVVYRHYEWNVAAGNGQVTLLAVKHIFLAAVFLWGLIFYIKVGRMVRHAHE